MLSLIVVLSVIAFDLFSKYLVLHYLKPIGSVTVFPGILDFTYVENRGAAFGMLSESRWVFMVASAILIFALIYALVRFNHEHPLLLVSLSMILGGGIGNMIDRTALGYVVDFVEVTFVRFAVFNVADSAITVGVILLAIYCLFFEKDFFISHSKKDNHHDR